MKTLLVLALLTASTNVFANETSDSYCADESKKSFIVRADIEREFNGESVERGEVVAKVSNGNSVIVPCYGIRAIKKDTWRIDSYIMSSENVFAPINGKVVGNSKAIGVNLETSKYLVEQKQFFLLKRFLIVHSNRLEERKILENQSKIDRR